MLNIVLPMTDRGGRFRLAGATAPKPLIGVHGHPMIELVIANLRPSRPHRFLFLCLDEHLLAYDLRARLEAGAPDSEVVAVEGVTRGAAGAVLLARDLVDSDQPLMIAGSDQWVEVSIDDYLSAFDADGADGQVLGVAERQAVSNQALVGVYNLRRGSDFTRAAERMMAAGTVWESQRTWPPLRPPLLSRAVVALLPPPEGLEVRTGVDVPPTSTRPSNHPRGMLASSKASHGRSARVRAHPAGVPDHHDRSRRRRHRPRRPRRPMPLTASAPRPAPPAAEAGGSLPGAVTAR